MKKNYILALFLGLSLIVVTYFISKGISTDIVKATNTDFSNSIKVSEINKEEEKYVIKVYMPLSGIKELDEKVRLTYNEIIEDFVKQVSCLNLLEDGNKFSLNINFNNYEYENFYSFLINYSCDFGGAHPDSNIKTINYDINDNKFITIDNLETYNKNIINVFSKYSYENLSEKINFSENDDMLKIGTSPSKENFKWFVFSKDGILLFFPNYSVASYYLGDFEVLIPYDKIGF